MQQFDEQDYTQRFSLSLWRKILLYAKEYYPALFRLCVTMAVTAGCDVAFPLMTTYAIDHFIPNLDHAGTMEGLPGFIAVYLALLVLQVANIFYFLYLGGKIEVGVCYTIRKQAFRKLQELPFSYYDRMPVGYLMDFGRAKHYLRYTIDLCAIRFFLVPAFIFFSSIRSMVLIIHIPSSAKAVAAHKRRAAAKTTILFICNVNILLSIVFANTSLCHKRG